ncbi:MAG TPA: type II and III secretion system protein family protein [Rickettsiales bacterium]|nr:type II and III secretion system protein family protein [Rickettsiales bacterium]
MIFTRTLSHTRSLRLLGAFVCALTLTAAPQITKAASMDNLVGGLFVPVSRSELVVVPTDISEVLIADPSIADVHVIGERRLAIIGNQIGRTNAKIFDKQKHVIRQFDVVVGYDLPAIRRALHFFLPHEHIHVDLVNTNIALTGEVSDATVVDKAMRIVGQFVYQAVNGGANTFSGGTTTAATQSGAAASRPVSQNVNNGLNQYWTGDTPTVLNLLKVTSGQQVMLRVRVGEVQRDALKNLGISLSHLADNGRIIGATQNKLNIFDGSLTNSSGSTTTSALGVGGLYHNSNDAGFLMGTLTSGGFALSAAIEALETDGLLKILAEPDLVAMSGEKAEFLAGGEFPIIVPQVGGTAGAINTVQFQSYGVAVQFVPYVLTDDRVRISVQPEVSEIDQSSLSITNVAPALVTRRAKTTVELAPGESFMIAGLMSDRLNSNINQIPGASSIPVLGALLRSTAYQRHETELVIAVTPYIVDPMKNSDVRLPTDDFRPASVMEQFFYGSLGAMSGEEYKQDQTPSLEGPVGFITD